MQLQFPIGNQEEKARNFAFFHNELICMGHLSFTSSMFFVLLGIMGNHNIIILQDTKQINAPI